MPFVNGQYVTDNRSPLDRLYGFQQRQAEMQKLAQQQEMMRQRQQILAEAYTPAQEGVQAIQAQQFVDPMAPQQSGLAAALGIQPQAEQAPSFGGFEAQPAKFDAESAVNRLYSIGDLEGASAIINDQYKGALSGKAGGQVKFGTGGDLIRLADGSLVKRLYSTDGSYKDIPIDGQKAGQIEYVKAGGKIYAKDPFTNETTEVIDVTLTPDQVNDANPQLQADIAEAKARGSEKGQSDAKAQAGAESAIPVYDKTLGIISELINHPGRAWGTGGTAIWASAVPGTPAYDFKTKLAQLSGQNFLTEIQRMKGQGSLSDSEGKRLESASAALDAAQSEPEFLKQLMQLQSELQFYKQRAERKAAGQTAATSAPAPRPAPSRPAPAAQRPGAPKQGTIKNGYVFMGGNPADPKSWRKL